MSAVELHNTLYALGGQNKKTVQKLSLDSLTWEFMQLELPRAAFDFPCFKKDTEVYLVINRTLFSFTPLEVTPIGTLAVDIGCSSSYYSTCSPRDKINFSGTLYYEEGRSISLIDLRL
jgi:hypothetical protein